MEMDATETVLDRLRREYPDWVFWKSNGSTPNTASWYGTRKRRLSAEDMKEGLAATVVGDSLDELEIQLKAQLDERQVRERTS